MIVFRSHQRDGMEDLKSNIKDQNCHCKSHIISGLQPYHYAEVSRHLYHFACASRHLCNHVLKRFKGHRRIFYPSPVYFPHPAPDSLTSGRLFDPASRLRYTRPSHTADCSTGKANFADTTQNGIGSREPDPGKGRGFGSKQRTARSYAAR
jgi:hypothetical protein